MEQADFVELQKAWVEFKTTNDTLQAEVKQFGKASGEILGRMEKLEGRFVKFDSFQETELGKLAKQQAVADLLERIDRIEAAVNRKGTGAAYKYSTEAKQAEANLKKSAFLNALRWSGLSHFNPMGKSLEQSITPDEFKALTLSQDTAGGYLSPPEYVQEILAEIVEWSPLRALCRSRSTTRTEVLMPRRTGTAAASWVAETGTRSETTNPTFGMDTFRTHELYAMVAVSRQELEDSIFNLEQFLRAEIAEQFGVSEGLAFISGNAVGKPEGFTSNASVTYTASGDANLLTADGLIGLYYDIKEAYLNNATWVMSRSTLKEVRKLKDGNGNYLWAPGIRVDARPPAILDRPYVTCIDMPSITANAYPIAFGDWQRGYQVLDRLQMEMMVDPFTGKSTGMVEFSARKRVGGQVLIAEAIRKLKIATS